MKTKSNFISRLLVLLSFLFICIPGFSKKESHIYIGTNGKLTNLKDAIYIQKIHSNSSKDSKVQTYVLKDQKWEKIYSEHYKKLNDSTWQINANGENIPAKTIRIFTKQADNKWKFKDIVDKQIVRKGFAQSIIPLLFNGQVIEYYPGGNKKSISIYKNNELVSNENWNDNGEKYIDNVFYSVDTPPTFSGGNKIIHEHIINGYKNSGLDISVISGSVIVGFVVMENGSIDGIKILKGLGPMINAVANEAFNSLKGNWKPAKLNNQTVRYFQIFPINFIINENHFEFAELRGATLHYQTY